MIAGIMHSGSGLGNQLHRYVATRVLALDKGYEFSMIAPENFKGKSFMNLDMGVKNHVHYDTLDYSGEVVPRYSDGPMDERIFGQWAEKTNYYNPEINFVKDRTIIDGEFQDERYFGHHLDKMLGWFNIRPELMSGFFDDVCVIGFRGGEFALFPELFLTKEYWDEAISMMRQINPDMAFKVVTDDVPLAKQFFPDFQVGNEIGDDWTSVLFGKYSIVANSSFYILPRLLAHHHKFRGEPTTIAPRFWARRNTREWSMPQNYYKAFKYI